MRASEGVRSTRRTLTEWVCCSLAPYAFVQCDCWPMEYALRPGPMQYALVPCSTPWSHAVRPDSMQFALVPEHKLQYALVLASFDLTAGWSTRGAGRGLVNGGAWATAGPGQRRDLVNVGGAGPGQRAGGMGAPRPIPSAGLPLPRT